MRTGQSSWHVGKKREPMSLPLARRTINSERRAQAIYSCWKVHPCQAFTDCILETEAKLAATKQSLPHAEYRSEPRASTSGCTTASARRSGCGSPTTAEQSCSTTRPAPAGRRAHDNALEGWKEACLARQRPGTPGEDRRQRRSSAGHGVGHRRRAEARWFPKRGRRDWSPVNAVGSGRQTLLEFCCWNESTCGRRAPL